GNGSGGDGGSESQAYGSEISGDERAARHREGDEAAEPGVLKHHARDHVPQPGQVEPLLVAAGEGPGIMQRNVSLLPDQVSGGEVQPQIVRAEQQRAVRDVVDGGEGDQEDVDSGALERGADGPRSPVSSAAPGMHRVHYRKSLGAEAPAARAA